ncbi:MAG: bifunctional aspartate kinase/diaminopimelate decarboxylase [Gammaproteobacteria bacterium]
MEDSALREAPFTDARSLGAPEEYADSRWVVMKFGGTSIASRDDWERIAGLLTNRMEAGLRPLVVCSAVGGVSNSLHTLIRQAIGGDPDPVLEDILARHRQLADELDIDADAVIGEYFAELRQLAAGVRLIREASPRVQARLMALGELMSTRLGGAWLGTLGMDLVWADARDFLSATEQRHKNERQHFLSAVCLHGRDPSLEARLAAANEGAILTQGFIARNVDDETVLLGRGGSDTSAAYFASLLGARRLEIWTDVPGMFSANPRAVPSARLLTALHYDEAQEIASTGGSVLHPRCVPPMRRAEIPIHVRWTGRPDLPGTVVSAATPEVEPQVKAISLRMGLTLVSMEGVAMWQEVGFLADAFELFRRHSVSVDLISTSESNVTVSIDTVSGTLEGETLETLVEDIGRLCRVRIIEDCAAVSLVGRKIRTILHRLGPALEVFEEQRIHLVSQAANDLNLTFVVDDEQGYRLVQKLHSSIIGPQRLGEAFGPTWEELQSDERKPRRLPPSWWSHRRDELLELSAAASPRYVYDGDTIRAAIGRLRAIDSVDAVFYAMKANSNPDVLRLVEAEGVNFECVSPGEIARVLELFPGMERERILFTPNFAPREEYAAALDLGVWVTLDNLHTLREWPDVFRGRDVFIRLDPGQGRGHHEHVRTAGTHSKFGIPLFELDELEALAAGADCRIVGIHAHTGSGILDPTNWAEVAGELAAAASRFPDVHTLDLGGGLGIPEKPGQEPLDTGHLARILDELKRAYPDYRLWLEPGRYLVAEAGVLLARVTQTKGKGAVRYVGIETGMNSLIRPALYGAYHEIVNLTRLKEPATEIVTVVGPICESGDRLGNDRLLPECREGDLLLIANTGAYGYTMSSSYNLREPAAETVI